MEKSCVVPVPKTPHPKDLSSYRQVEVAGERRMKAKLSFMIENNSHPLQDTLTVLESSFSDRLLHPKCVKDQTLQPAVLPADHTLTNTFN